MDSDPRVFFAAERTLLAWVRTGITVMALGFVVAKFGLFLTLLSSASVAANASHHNNEWSNIFGIVLVIIGVTITIGAQYNHQFYIKTLPPGDVPKLSISWLPTLLAASVAIVGLLLAVYLLIA